MIIFGAVIELLDYPTCISFLTLFCTFISGGLFICLPAENALGFCEEILEKDGYPAWVIGRVVEGEKKAYIAEEVTIAEV